MNTSEIRMPVVFPMPAQRGNRHAKCAQARCSPCWRHSKDEWSKICLMQNGQAWTNQQYRRNVRQAWLHAVGGVGMLLKRGLLKGVSAVR